MSTTEFAMVEELAFLVKDNLRSKHLILSMEDALVNFLQEDNCSDGILELEPMDSYSRLLLHRLADIFGFAHESVGEGDNRHLILERCPETSIPSILVSDILWHHDEPLIPTTSHQLLRRTEASPVVQTEKSPLQHSLEEREAAYLAARERIFSMGAGEVKETIKQKPRTVPVVARRMIAHALGQRINPCNQDGAQDKCKEQGELAIDLNLQGSNMHDSFIEASSTTLSGHKSIETAKKEADKSSSDVNNETNGGGGSDDYLKREHLGAAKRMFAHALGLPAGKTGFLQKCSEKKGTT